MYNIHTDMVPLSSPINVLLVSSLYAKDAACAN